MENTTLIGKNSVNRTITGLILLNLLVILVIAKSLYENRLSNEHRAKASIEILSHSLEKDIADTFSKIDIILQVIAEKSTQLSTDDSKWNKELETAQKRIPIVKSLIITDEAGNLIQKSDNKSKQPDNISNLDYFIRIKADPKADLLITQPTLVPGFSTTNLLLFRRINKENGSFNGVVQAILPLDYFDGLFNELQLGSNGSIAFRDSELRMILRHPSFIGGGEAGATKISDDFKAALNANPNRGTYTAGITSIDGVQRIHSYRRNETYGFYINVGYAYEDFLFQWQHYTVLSLLLAVIFIAASIVLGWFITKSWKQERITMNLLQANENRLRAIFEASADAICVSCNGLHNIVNPGYLRMFGYNSFEELKNLPVIDRIAPSEKERIANHLQLWSNSDSSQQQTSYETLGVKRDGQELPIEVHASKYSAANVTYIVAILHDITERKRTENIRVTLESQNRRIEKAESLGRMAGAIAHLFNNQLQIVMLNLEICMKTLPKDKLEYITDAGKATRKAAEVSTLMLTYLGQASALIAPLDIAESCLNTLPLLKTDMPKNVSLEINLPTPGPIIKANQAQIKQILTSLFTNALEAIDNNQGEIRVVTTTTPAQNIPTANRFPIDWHPQENSYACLEVADSGCGIPSENIEKLFDPFFSTKFTGRGLSLPVVLGIIKAHQGVITIESAPGKGATFRLFFPILRESLTLISSPTTKTDVVSNSGTVLVIDDEISTCKLLALNIRLMGFKVLTAYDGIPGVETFREHQSDIRLVICDVTMPQMGGWKTLNALRQLAPNIPVILSSGYNEAHVMDGNHPELPQAFLKKPFEIDKLKEIIFQVLSL